MLFRDAFAALLFALPPTHRQDPRTVAALAAAAVAGDSVAPVAARWMQRLQRDAGDRAALLGLAELARLTYHPSRAQALYDRLVGPPGRPRDRYALYARLGEARAANSRGQQREADSIAEMAVTEAAALGDRVAESYALISAAMAALRRSGPPGADALLRRADALLPDTVPDLLATYHCARASELILEDRSKASHEVARGVAFARQARSPVLEAKCLASLAADLARRGRTDSAVALYSTIITEWRRARDYGDLAGALQWRGYIRRTLGDYGDARQDLNEAIVASDRSGNAATKAWALNNLAWISLTLGDPVTGAGFASRAESLFATQDDRYGVAVTREQQGGIAFALGDMPRAREAYLDARRRYEALGFGFGAVTASITLAHVGMLTHDWEFARLALDEARRVARRYGITNVEPELSYHFGALALRQAHLRDAKRLFDTALREPGKREPDLAYTIRARLAEIDARRGEARRAVAELTAAENALDAWRSSLNDRDLKVLALQIGIDQSDPALGIATVIAAIAKQGDIGTAFRLAERLRARELLDEMTRARALGDGGARGVLTNTGADRQVELADVEAAIPDDSTALLEYVADPGDETTTLFVVTRAGAFARFLASDDSLAGPVTRFQMLLAAGADPRPLARVLGAKLLDPALNNLPPRIVRLVVVREASLYALPFVGLTLADGRYLAERYDISLVPSAGVAIRLWQEPPRSDLARVLVLADPAYASSTVAVSAASTEGLRAAFAGNGGLPRLRGSAAEARAVAEYAPAVTLLERQAASEAWLKRNSLTPYRIIHFATHALVDNRAFGRSALALSPGAGEDGFVHPGEILRLRLAADIVVLSACRTGGGVVVRGEGVQGLTVPFLEAGARSVVVTWWPIGDRQTTRFVSAFYRSLASGRTAGDALREARRELISQGAPPSVWAAFTLVGDAFVRVPLRLPARHPSGAQLAAWGGALLIAAGVGYGAVKRKRPTPDRGRVPSARST